MSSKERVVLANFTPEFTKRLFLENGLKLAICLHIKQIFLTDIRDFSFKIYNLYQMLKNIQSFSPFGSSENCALLGYYTASTGNFLPTFWNNLSVPSSSVKNPRRLGTNTTRYIIVPKRAVLIYFTVEF
jgi:hypothetical protein